MGLVQMGYGARTFSTHINNGRGPFFRKHIHGANTLLVHSYELFFVLDTTCAENKDKPMAGCKNQLIKKCLRNSEPLKLNLLKYEHIISF